MPETTAAKASMTRLMTNDQLARVSRMRLLPIRRKTSRMQGENKSRESGTSIEFRDYRDYTAGDDMRFVDWNIFSRLHRPYVKLFHEEEQMNIVLLIDASTSMVFEGKLERALALAGAFSTMGLMMAERVSLYVFNQKGGEATRLRPRRGRAAMREVFQFLEGIEGGGEEPVDEGIEAMLRVHRGRGLVVLLSDFLTHRSLRRAFNQINSRGLEPFALQILSPVELNPDLSTDLRLVDSETLHTLDITAGGDLLSLYHEYRQGFQEELDTLARQRGGRYLCLDAAESLDETLFDTLRRKGWVQ